MNVTEAVRRITREATDLDTARREVDRVLRRAVGYDVGAFSTVDPATGLWTSCYVSGLDAAGAPERERTIYELELTGDVNRFSDLAQREVPVATLHQATAGDVTRARRWAPLLEPLGVIDEVRAVLRTGGETWGTLVLYRTGSAQPFTVDDVATLAAAAPGIAGLFRLMLIRLALTAVQPAAPPPGGFTALPDASLTAVSGSARSWLGALDVRGRIPAVVQSVAAAVRTTGAEASVSVPTPRGGFVTLYGSPIAGSDSVAVVIDVARSPVIGGVLAHAYGLTAREREVAGLAALGHSTREMARDLGISPFTVTDHLKSLYAKVGVSSRSELVAALHQPRHRSVGALTGTRPVSWYLDHNVG